MRLTAISTAAALVALTGCALDRTGVGAPGRGDAGLRDALVEELDAGDASDALVAIDAFVPIDAPIDAGCTPVDETCNARDDDCDGAIDEEDVCGCPTMEWGGHVYLDCPDATGYAAWGGACRRRGPGYDLAIIDSGAEDDALVAWLDRDVWIGLNDFEANGTYVWVDHTTASYVGELFPGQGTNDWERCFALRRDGYWDDYPCSWTHHVLCEGDPARRPACEGASTSEADATCDGIDDDCDGDVDEDCDLGRSCTSFTFWDRAYQVCTGRQNAADAERTCGGGDGYALVSIHSAGENDALDQRVGDAWIGLRQRDGRSAVDEGWGWVDGSPLDYRAWAPAEPNDSNFSENDQENCARMQLGGGWYDRGCGESNEIVCAHDFVR